MQKLTRRTVFAAVPVLAAMPLLAAVPAIASIKPEQGKRSPRLAELIKHYHWSKAEGRKLSDKLNNQPRPDGYKVAVENMYDQLLDLKGDLADEISGTRAESFADLQAQFDIWFDYYVYWKLDGTPDEISNMGGPELRFLVRLPDEIARLSGTV